MDAGFTICRFSPVVLILENNTENQWAFPGPEWMIRYGYPLVGTAISEQPKLADNSSLEIKRSVANAQ